LALFSSRFKVRQTVGDRTVIAASCGVQETGLMWAKFDH
jgi:hypothetical protein